MHRERLSQRTLRLWVRTLPSLKCQQNLSDEHTSGQRLMRCHQTFQKSGDFCCSSVFNPVRCVSRCIFCSSNGSSASPVVLKPWNHQFGKGKTNGWHSRAGNTEHGERRFGPGSGAFCHSLGVQNPPMWPSCASQEFYVVPNGSHSGAQEALL